ncbi:MAG: A/G-specific adenine glycosylase [Hyphomonadaceae bacterium]|nr:A/G-specific adenine glycosylase [Hyphomonadaceae bacterium]
MKTSTEKQWPIVRFRQDLLAWYDAAGRTLPWRIRPEDRQSGIVAEPYKVWLSEIMCQQTTVVSAAPYWRKFLEKWPTIQHLAEAQRDDILAAWAGLGYYARARNLHKCANTVIAEYGGCFPNSETKLLKLPGIGPYTAAAIASICFDQPATVVDGNVERVISRVYQIDEPLPKSKSVLRKSALELTDPDRPGDYAQAIMDLGATICKPKNPKCDECPWSFGCLAYQAGQAAEYPKKLPKKQRPTRYGAVFYLEDDEQILLRQRPDKGLLGGMMELPGTDWTHELPPVDHWMSQAPITRNWQALDDNVVHVFTHFTLQLQVFSSIGPYQSDGVRADLSDLEKFALPTVMMKAIKSARSTPAE